MREEFEKWAADKGLDVSRNVSNQYLYMSTYKAWKACQKEIDAGKSIQELDMKVDVRTVLYTDDLEPITVLELPSWSRDYLERHGVVRLAVTMTEVPVRIQQEERPTCQVYRTVDVWSEPFVRNGKTHLMLFTHNDENALLLKSSFLPGQRRELRDQLADAFSKGFLKAIRELGER